MRILTEVQCSTVQIPYIQHVQNFVKDQFREAHLNALILKPSAVPVSSTLGCEHIFGTPF